MRSQRRKDLLRLLRDGTASTQEEIVAALRTAGHEVTQATVSRDLSQVGAAKLRVNGSFVYVLPDEVSRAGGGDLTSRNLERTLDEFALDVAAAGTLVVVRTAPGHAAAVARAIDLAADPGVVGTIAGDDTIFVATRRYDDAHEITRRWNGGSA